MPKGHLPLVYRSCPTIEVLQAWTHLETAHAIAILLDKPRADGVADTRIMVFNHLAKPVSTRRGGCSAPHVSPVETA